MRTRLVSLALFLLLIAASLPAFAHHTSADTPGGATTVGKSADSKWTDTTIKAAATDANKKVLASGKPATVTGEVVEVSCYLQLGKRGEAHIPCGTKCINNGQPIGLVDAQNNLYLLFAEEHDPRRDGAVTLKDAFLPLLAKQATVSGMMTQMKGGIRALYVTASTLSSMKPVGDQK